MSARAVSRLYVIIVVVMIIAGLSAYFVSAHFDIEAKKNLLKIQTFKLKDNRTLKQRVEQLFPGGKWTGGELASKYKVDSIVLYWDVKDNRVLAASKYTMRQFPELTPNIDEAVIKSLDEFELINPFQFELDHPARPFSAK